MVQVMCSPLQSLSLALWFVACARAQTSSVSVPADLSSKFDPNSISLQVNYDNKAEFGFANGAHISPQQTSKTPVFALGDASGVNTAISFLLVMLDTTTNNRVLHFVQPDFKANGDETAISSSANPALAYAAPGMLGESGSSQYSFLLYQQVGTFPSKSIPSAGQTINMQIFQSDNNLQDALAGVVMVVDLDSASSSSASAGLSPSTASSSLSSTGAVLTSGGLSAQTTAAATTISVSSAAAQSTLLAASNSVVASSSFTLPSTTSLTTQNSISGSLALTASSSTLARSSAKSPTATVAASNSSIGSSTQVLSAGLISFLAILTCVILS
ncbi:hypothetical protein MMC14_001019 [Varicellaria rhodocarpa]|nr:hypothetical protein [Varicellaria rhodocarpa]